MLSYDPITNQMIVSGAAGTYAVTPNDTATYPYTWAYNLASNTWTQLANNNLQSPIDTITVYDSANQMIYGINHQIGLQEYNAATNTWTAVGNGSMVSDYHMTGAIDPGAGILVAAGGGFLNVVNLTTGALTSPSVSGDLTAQNGSSPGFVWDPAINEFVGWNGGSTLYTLDPTTWQWTAHTAALDNTVMPTDANANGTFGRFQYDAADNVFIVVNATNQDVYVLKPNFGPSATAAAGGTAPQMVDQGSGNEMFVFNNMKQAGSTIENFDPTHDTLSLTALLQANGLGATDPTANGTITIDASGADSTAINLHNGGHVTTLVTLDHVLPTSVPHTDIIWH